MFGGGLTFSSTQGYSTSPEKPQKRSDDRTNCLPVTIRMLEIAHESAKTADGELRFHGSETTPAILSLLAQVETVHANQSMMAEFDLCDSTGRIRARFYATEQSEQDKALDSLAVGAWVRVFGQFRSAPVPHFSVSIMRPIESADEISHHCIEVVHGALKCLQHNGATLEPPKTPQPKAVRQSQDEPMEPAATPEKPQSQEKQMEVDCDALTQKLPGAQQPPALEGTALSDSIMGLLDALKAQGDEVGLTAPQLLATIEQKGSKVAEGEGAVRAALDKLQDLGDVFTTIDDDHFGIP